MPKIFGISYLRVIKRSEMKNIRLTFATVTVLSFCSGFINPIWAGKSDEKNFEISRNLDIFNSLFKELNMFYVDTINAEKAIGDGVNAMLARLDPYTEYIPEKEKDDFFFSTTGEYAGIGSFIMERDNAVYISEPYEGMPAQLAGLRPGDKIVMIDNDTVLGWKSAKVSERLKGPANTQLKVTVERPGVKDLLSLNLPKQERQEIALLIARDTVSNVTTGLRHIYTSGREVYHYNLTWRIIPWHEMFGNAYKVLRIYLRLLKGFDSNRVAKGFYIWFRNIAAITKLCLEQLIHKPQNIPYHVD